MANTGYLTSSGIQQVFTTGPLSGSIVTSSYSIGSTFFGPTVNFKQSFISGTVDDIYPCSSTPQIFYRYYLDPLCAACITPILISGTTECINEYDFNYTINRGEVNSTETPYTVVYFSTTPDFSFNTGSYIQNNLLNSGSLSINVSSSLTSPIPGRTTPVYFKAFNSCSAVLSSSFSNTLIVSCSNSAPTSSYSNFILDIENSFFGASSIQYSYNGSNYNISFNQSSSITFATETLSIPVKILGLTESSDNMMFIDKLEGNIEGVIATVITDRRSNITNTTSLTEYPGTAVVNIDNNNTTVDLTIDIDRNTFTNTGRIKVDITSLTPLEPE
jgi:hypothetical protein